MPCRSGILPSSPDNAGVVTVARPFPRAEEVNLETTASIELQQEALESAYGTPPQSVGRRTASELLERAQVLGDVRRAKEAKERARKKAKREREAAKRRQEHLGSLKGQEPKLWSQVTELIDTRQPKRYDDAVAILRDLHDLAGLQGDMGPFRMKMSALHDEHRRKTTLVERFRKAKLLGG